MKLENEFTVPASVDEAWNFLLDVPRVAPCLPGATVEPETDADGAYKGAMKIKIGPITAQYKGTVRIQDSDAANHTVAMRATAKDARGQGSASATITSRMEETPEGTRVLVETDMRVTGPAAQFGRGVMQDVSAKLMTRFAECIATQLSGNEAPTEEEPAATANGAAAETVPTATAGEPEAPSASSGVSSAEAEPEAVPSASSGVSSAEPEAVPSASSGVSSAEPEAAPSASSGVSSAEPEAAPEPKPAAAAPRPTDDVLDLGEASRDALLKRAIPLVGAAIGVLILLRILRR